MVKDSKYGARNGPRREESRKKIAPRPSEPEATAWDLEKNRRAASAAGQEANGSCDPGPALRPQAGQEVIVGFTSSVTVAFQPAALPGAHRACRPAAPRGHYPRLRPPSPNYDPCFPHTPPPPLQETRATRFRASSESAAKAQNVRHRLDKAG